MDKKAIAEQSSEIKTVDKDNNLISVYCPSSQKIATNFLINLRELLSFDSRFVEEAKKCWYVLPKNNAILGIISSLKNNKENQDSSQNFVMTKDQYLNILDRLNKLEYPTITNNELKKSKVTK